jgi:hypothetical protein
LNCLAINLDFMLIWVKLRSELSDLPTIDCHSSIHDEFIGAATACDSSVGNNLIQAHLGHEGYPFSTVNSPAPRAGYAQATGLGEVYAEG